MILPPQVIYQDDRNYYFPNSIFLVSYNPTNQSISPGSNLLDLENGLNSSDALTTTPQSESAIPEGMIQT